MPELPEVETVVRDLRPMLIGRSFTKIAVSKQALRRRWSRAWNSRLPGKRVEAILRRGKWILIHLNDTLTPPPAGREEAWLVVHLGMTGQFTVGNGPTENHTHVVFTLDDGNQLRFRDVRRFGSVTCYRDRAAVNAFFAENRLGPEPFECEPTYWSESLRSTRRNLKAILLDQTVIAGVGNIYADEALFEARLHPARIGRSLPAPKAESLRQAIITVLKQAIERRGSSIRDYIGGSGLKGRMQEEFRVYGRTGEPCLCCRTPIAKIVLAGRSTHFCPKCQRKHA